MNYLFQLGRLTTISIAEILCFFKESEIKNIFPQFAHIEPEQKFDSKEIAQQFLRNLGGIPKILKIFAIVNSKEEIIETIKKYLIENYGANSKIIFGLNAYFLSNNFGISLESLLKTIKRDLQKEDFSVRFLNRGQGNIEIPIFFKEKLNTKKGSELNIIKIQNDFYLAETIAVQEINEYSFRDFDKPFRDAKTGMLPPKLAQILINLGIKNANRYSLTANHSIIIDPFCGSGTILMESLLMGLNTYGSDTSEKQLEGAKQNIKWLRENFEINPELKSEISLQNAENFEIPKNIENPVIVTEGYLGPPQSRFPHPNLIHSVHENLFYLYSNFFKKLKSTKIKSIVLTLPAYKDAKNYVLFEEFLEIIEKSGFELICPFSDNFLKTHPYFFLSNRGTLIYDRDNQIVGREIIILKSS
ncbi:MAG: DNA methyltransferase [Candidatus Woesearchaeota archaeon]|jgi:tRNA G10  N-methylase Trm11